MSPPLWGATQPRLTFPACLPLAAQSAACCLLLVDHIEGTATAHALALRLIRAALKGGQYELVAELLRCALYGVVRG